MQALISQAVDEIALEGVQGCSINRLVHLLREGGPESCPQFQQGIPACVLEWLFEMLKLRTLDITFMRKKSADSELVPLNPVPKLESLSDDDKEKIMLLASQGVRDASLGLYDEHLSNFSISSQQRETLEMVGRRRGQGALRTELASHLRCDSGKFHYVIKLLESRRLIVLSPVLTREDTSKMGHRVQTSIVHLKRFAPRLSAGQIFTDEDAEPGTFTVCDDQNRQMQLICHHLSKANDQTLVESELKKLLGFRLTKGHRGWRKVRASLERSGHITGFEAYLPAVRENSEMVKKNIIKLIKPYTAPRKAAKGQDAEDEEDDNVELNPEDTTAERGMDWQIITILAKAGNSGIARHVICKRLGVSMKRMKKQLDEIALRFGVIETNEQNGKLVEKRWVAPESILAHFKDQQDGPQPPGGFQRLVQSAMKASNIPASIQQALQQRSPAPSASAPSSSNAPGRNNKEVAPSSSQGPGDQAVEALLGVQELESVIPHQQSLQERSLAEPAHEPHQAPALLEDFPEGRALPKLPVDLLDDVSAITVEAVGVTNDVTSKITTSTAQNRLERLCKKVEQDRFILRVDVANFFQMGEEFQGAFAFDKRTIMRIIDRGVATGVLQHLCIHNPGKIVNKPENIFVVVKPGLEVQGNHDLIREIREDQAKRVASRYSKPNRSSKGEIQHIENITRLNPSSGAKGQEREDDEEATEERQINMWENGLLHARMTKARLLHSFLCKLVGLAGCSEGLRNVLEPELTDKTNPDQLQDAVLAPVHPAGPSLPRLQRKDPKSEKEDNEEKVTLSQVAETNKGLFTIHALLPVMPLDLFCQVVGCSNKHAAIQELILRAVPVGSLTQEEYQAIVDIHAKRRLSKILKILSNMGLVNSALYALNTQFTQTERSIFIVKPDVTFQEPEKLTDPEAAEGAYREVSFDLRAEEDVDGYWNRLEYACMEAPEAMHELIPGRMVEDLFRMKAWSKDRMMSIQTWFDLRQVMAEQIEDFGWQHRLKAANDLGLDPEQVTRIAILYRQKVNRKRERLQMGVLPRLAPTNRKSGVTKYESKTTKRQENYRKYKKTQRGWTVGLPGRSTRRILLRPWEPVETDALKLQQAVRALNESDEEEDDDEPERPLGIVSRRLGWTLDDDRLILSGYIKWHLVSEFHDCAFRSQCRRVNGTTLTERQCYKRTKELESNPKVGALMDRLQTLIKKVHKRLDARGRSQKALLNQQAKRYRLAEKAKRDAEREERRKEHAKQLREASGLPPVLEQDEEKGEEEQIEDDKVAELKSRFVVFPEPEVGDSFFETVDAEDQEDHDRMNEIFRDILSMAPRRVDANFTEPVVREVKKRRRSAVSSIDADEEARKNTSSKLRNIQKSAAQPPTSTVQQLSSLHTNLQRHVNRKSLSRSRILAGERAVVTPAVACAMELAVVLMSLTEEERDALPGSATALSRRFSDDQISNAFSQLRLHNFVYHDFVLSQDFRALSQIADLPEHVFGEASEMLKSIEASETGIVTLAETGEELLGGTVAQVLELMSAGLATLAVPPTEDLETLLSAPKAQLGLVSTREIDWPVTADCLQGRPDLPPGLQMAPYQPPEPVCALPDLSKIMGDEAYRAELLGQCKERAASIGNCSADAVETVYRQCQQQAIDGLSEQQLKQHLSDSMDVQACRAAFPMLLDSGLLTQVPGYDDWVYVPSELSAPYFTDPSDPPSTASSSTNLAEKGPKLKGRPNKRGTRLLAPWLDHKGSPVEKAWRRIVLQALSLILNNAGISEEDLIADMPTLTPMSVKRLLAILGQKQMILVQEVDCQEIDLPAIFAPASTPKVQRHYFIDPRNCFSLSTSVQP